jgi:hypothetical protein
MPERARLPVQQLGLRVQRQRARLVQQGLRSELVHLREARAQVRGWPGVLGRARLREARGRLVVLEVGPRSCRFILVNLLPVGWLTNNENPNSTGSHPSMDSPASLP